MQYPPGFPNTLEFNSHVVLVPEELIPHVYPGSCAKALIEIAKEAVTTDDHSRVRDLVRSLLMDPVKAGHYEGRVAFSIAGYTDDPRFLSEIPEVVRFARTMMDKVPEWLFLLERNPAEINMWIAILTEAKGMQHPSGNVDYNYEVEKFAEVTQGLLHDSWPAACRNLGRSVDAPDVNRALDAIIECINSVFDNPQRAH